MQTSESKESEQKEQKQRSFTTKMGFRETPPTGFTSRLFVFLAFKMLEAVDTACLKGSVCGLRKSVTLLSSSKKTCD